MPQAEYLTYGGQAVIEGVMMRSPHYFSVAVRAPNGQIVVQTEALAKTWVNRQKWLKLPFLRGTWALLDSMALGHRALRFASEIQMDPKFELKPDGETPAVVESNSQAEAPSKNNATNGVVRIKVDEHNSINRIQVGLALVIGLVFGLLLFGFAPNLLAEQMRGLGYHWAFTNLVTEILKIIFVITYIALIRRVESIHRVFMYHGAEHKAINTLEADQPLEMSYCKLQTRLHPRCGTSFAIVVLLTGLLLFTFVPRYPIEGLPTILNVLVRFLIEIAILPIIAGIAYEAIRFAGKFRNKSYVKALFAPGLATQYLTTVEPEESHIEVALEALRSCVNAEEGARAEKIAQAPTPAAV